MSEPPPWGGDEGYAARDGDAPPQPEQKAEGLFELSKTPAGPKRGRPAFAF